MRIKNNLSILILLFILISCEEEFWPSLERYEDLLVVDAVLSNDNDLVEVKLSISSPVNNKAYIPVSDAEVWISENDQAVQRLTETEEGRYRAVDTAFRGRVGKAYQLHIKLPNGKNYESDVCSLLAPSPIDSVYGLAESPTHAEQNHEFPGIQFYVENHSLESDTTYYYWKLSQTFKYRSTFDIDLVWEGAFYEYPNPDSLRTCWRTSNVNEIIVASTEYLNPTAVNSFPLNFVSTDTKKLSIRYSLLVKQLRVSEEVFTFYDAIAEQNIDQEDLWSKQPIQILGNVHNVNDSQEPVLGYFIVAGASEKRIFMDRPEIPFYYTECTPDYDLRFIAFEPVSAWPIYIDDIMFLGLAKADERRCFDCRLDGGSITPPYFWED